MALVQSTAVAKFGSGTSRTLTLTGVTAGNMLILRYTHVNFVNSGSGLASVSDAQGSYTKDSFAAYQSHYECGIYRLSSATSGTHAVVCTATESSAYGQLMLSEYSGTTGTLDQQAKNSNAGSTGPISSGATATLSASTSVAIAAAFVSSQQSGWGAPSGWSNTYTDTTGGELATSFADLTLNSSAAVTANFGVPGGSTGWGACVAIYDTNTAQSITGSGGVTEIPTLQGTSSRGSMDQGGPVALSSPLNQAIAGTATWTPSGVAITATGALVIDDSGWSFSGSGTFGPQGSGTLSVPLNSFIQTGVPSPGSNVMRILVVNPTGLVKWRDYIPVKFFPSTTATNVDTTNDNGALSVLQINSGVGLVAWVDYTPVVLVTDP